MPQNSQLSRTPLPLLPEFLPHPSPLSGTRGLSPRKGRKRDQWPEINQAINKSPCSQSQEKCYFKVNQSNFTQSPKCNLLHTQRSRQAPEVQEHSRRTKSNSLLSSAEGERRLTGQRQWPKVTAGLRQHGHVNRVSWVLVFKRQLTGRQFTFPQILFWSHLGFAQSPPNHKSP